MNRKFSESFVWGAATASYQVEGAAFDDGKGLSIWDEFVKRPSVIVDDKNANVTCDQYHQYKADVQLMKNLGLKAYRFSMSWSRVLPNGRGEINHKGLDYYKNLCDELLSCGIEPYMTFYHWDLPLALQEDFGGWESTQTIRYYGEYVDKISRELAGRVKNFFTFNEFLACSDVGYGMGLIAPGLKLDKKRLNQVRHNLLVAHGTGLQVLRSTAPSAKVTIAENPFFMLPVADKPEHIEAAKKAFREVNAQFLTAIMEGKYLDCYLAKEKADAPQFTDEEMKLIGQPMDMLGLNLYYGKQVKADPNSETGYMIFDSHKDQPTGVADFYFEPSSMYWGCRIVNELWQPKEIFITEHGMLANDRIDVDGNVYDPYRITNLRCYLGFLAQAIEESIPVKGYFHWSLLDNFEWHHGYRPRFGLFHVNFQTQKRTPKLSAEWYHDTIKYGRIS